MFKQLKMFFIATVVLTVGLSVFPDFAFAGPGGIIAKGPKALYLVLAVLFAPVIIYMLYKEHLAIIRAKKALNELAKMNDSFRFSVMKERVHAIVTHVYSAWGKADIAKAQDWMTDWYWQNQKLTVLEEWESQGLSNICKLKKVISVKPLYVDYSEIEPGDGEGTRVSLGINVNAQDYLIDQKTEKIVEGNKDFSTNNTIWTIILENGKWKLALIEEGSLSLQYARMSNNLEQALSHIAEGYRYKRSAN